MSMVKLALKRPYTFIVMAMLIVLATPLALRSMATDIFPEINIPVLSIIWNYNGLPAQEMGQRIASSSERGLTTTVSDIAQAGYQLTAANYRRVVLTAMQEVQDGIAGSAALDRALAQARLAEQSAGRVLALTTDRYEGGATTYLEVITAQQSLLNTQRQAAQLLGQRLLWPSSW